jgi:DNA-entry nuclease
MLDSLGRCGVAIACIGQDIMPVEERGSIGQVKPSGWHTVKYDIVDGKYLYNRCHLIGYQLTGENANEENLITGTRYLNIEGMLPFENMVADYVKETENHVLYRVTPIFDGENLVASGVQMEAWSVEDEGDGICFNVYCYNVQPGVVIDYATGKNWLDEKSNENEDLNVPKNAEFILNTSSKKIHKPDCSGATGMNEKNKQVVKGKDIVETMAIAAANGKWAAEGGIETSIGHITAAIETLRSFATELGNNYTVIETRQNFTEAMVDVLETGADKLVLADMNEESANYLALQTRQQLAINSLALASQSAQSVLSLF